jgi:hypothetical protein
MRFIRAIAALLLLSGCATVARGPAAYHPTCDTHALSPWMLGDVFIPPPLVGALFGAAVDFGTGAAWVCPAVGEPMPLQTGATTAPTAEPVM